MKYRVYPRLRTRVFNDGFIIGCPQSNIFVNQATMDFIQQVDESTIEDLESTYDERLPTNVEQFLAHLHYLGFVILED